MARPFATLLALATATNAHFVWLSANGHGEAVAEFNEPGRLTDPHLLGKLYNMTRGQVHTMDGTTSDLHFMTRGAGDGYHCAAEVYAPLPQQGSMAVEAQATYGLYAVGTDEGGTGEMDLLQYWATAVHPGSDASLDQWSLVEEAFTNDFEVTLRDPQGAAWATVAPSVDVSNPNNECEPDAATHESGDTCVVAVVRWKGQRATFDVTVSTYDHTGAKLRDSIAEDGVVVVRAPADAQTYALVHHAEQKPGTTEGGESYDVVNHYATTTFANAVHCHGGSCHTHAGAYAGPHGGMHGGGMHGGYGGMGSTSERKADGDHAGNVGMLFFFSLFSACLGGAIGFVLGARRTEQGFRLMFWRRGDARFDLQGSSKPQLSEVI